MSSSDDATLGAWMESGDPRAALERALVLWRKKPFAVLADIVKQLATHLGQGYAFVTCSGYNSVEMRAELDAFMKHAAADPRIFDALVALLSHPDFDLSAGNPRKLYDAVVGYIHALHDERVFPWVQQELESFLDAHKGSRHGQLSRKEVESVRTMFGSRAFMPAKIEPFDDDERAEVADAQRRLETLTAAGRAETERREALLRAVIAHWEDDEHKEVFADYLLEKGDVLGEWILLDLALAREGELDMEREIRHKYLRERHAKPFQPMGRSFVKGFATRVEFRSGDGNHYGSYGLELVWGTIRSADVPPTSDACHTENLRELSLATTFILDLAKLKKPLGVTHLTWHGPSETGRTKWKKMSVLPQLEHLTTEVHRPGALEFLVEGPGATVRTLVVRTRAVAKADLVAIRAWFDRSKALERAEIGEHVIFTRRAKEGVVMTVAIPTANVRMEVETALAELPKPFVDVMEVQGPSTTPTYATILGYGRTHRATFEAPKAAKETQRTRTGGELLLEPPQRFDSDALAWILKNDERAVERVTILDGGIPLEQLGELFRVVVAAGASELVLRQRFTGWRSDAAVVACTTSGAFRAEIIHDRQQAPIIAAARSLPVTFTAAEVRHSPDLDAGVLLVLCDDLRAITNVDVMTLPDDRVLARLFTIQYRASTRRAKVHALRYGHLLTPEVLEVLLTTPPIDPKSVHVEQADLDLATWIEWCRATKRTVSFQSSIHRRHQAIRANKDRVDLELLFESNDAARAVLAKLPDRSARRLTIELPEAKAPEDIQNEIARVANDVVVTQRE